uniref:Uncharacterized protein n=1 Tax=Trachysalambria curvirostris nimavirus TaxID=2984282 RepID=A0A9C7BIR2_9VIRU|nr:MAG: hypothetical protein [Trachysalambria curvirostris nimavirus]
MFTKEHLNLLRCILLLRETSVTVFAKAYKTLTKVAEKSLQEDLKKPPLCFIECCMDEHLHGRLWELTADCDPFQKDIDFLFMLLKFFCGLQPSRHSVWILPSNNIEYLLYSVMKKKTDIMRENSDVSDEKLATWSDELLADLSCILVHVSPAMDVEDELQKLEKDFQDILSGQAQQIFTKEHLNLLRCILLLRETSVTVFAKAYKTLTKVDEKRFQEDLRKPPLCFFECCMDEHLRGRLWELTADCDPFQKDIDFLYMLLKFFCGLKPSRHSVWILPSNNIEYLLYSVMKKKTYITRNNSGVSDEKLAAWSDELLVGLSGILRHVLPAMELEGELQKLEKDFQDILSGQAQQTATQANNNSVTCSMRGTDCQGAPVEVIAGEPQ